MAAAISAADRSFSLVIQFLHLNEKPHVQLLYGNGEAIRPIKGTYPHIASTPREVGVSHDHEFRSFVRLLCLTRAPPPQLEVEVRSGSFAHSDCLSITSGLPR
jgi:hypothetical protein